MVQEGVRAMVSLDGLTAQRFVLSHRRQAPSVTVTDWPDVSDMSMLIRVMYKRRCLIDDGSRWGPRVELAVKSMAARAQTSPFDLYPIVLQPLSPFRYSASLFLSMSTSAHPSDLLAIDVTHLDFAYNGEGALHDVDLQVEQGER